MKLTDICPNIFCINLLRRTDRLERVLEQSKKFEFPVTVSVAVDARDIENPTRLRDGEYALLLSHLKVIERAKSQNFSSIIVFEDDFECIEDFNERLIQFSEIPNDWDLVYLGANNFHLGAGNLPPYQVSENILRVFSSFTTHAMLIKDTIYDSVIDKIKRFDSPLDIIYGEIQREKKAFCFFPNICKQFDSYSDIINFNPEYNRFGIFDN